MRRCLATIGGYAQRDAVGMDIGAMRDITSFVNIASGNQNLIRRDTQKHRQHGDPISLLLFFQNKEIMLKMCI
jgi:hypothetical protein